VNGAEVDTRPVGPADLAVLAGLFAEQRNTRHCWCTAFCSTPRQFALGWLTGGNRRHFEALTSEARTPMGVLATVADRPAAWCACGPRSRYAVALDRRSSVMSNRAPEEDDSVWLVPCLLVAPQYRGRGLTSTLVDAAAELARRAGAAAIEGWPYTGSDPKSADGFLGRERVFSDLGFRCTSRPSSDRAIMRLELGEDPRIIT
jgi:GNAT superfamily N-acetyltransferase